MARVIVGAIGYVPVEEYLFFLLQPCSVALHWLLSTSEPVQGIIPLKCEVSVVLWLRSALLEP